MNIDIDFNFDILIELRLKIMKKNYENYLKLYIDRTEIEN